MHRHILSYGCFVFAIATLFVYTASLFASAKWLPVDMPLPSVSAQGAVLMEASSGETVYEKNAHIKLPMASTTKIMTAIIAIEHCDPAMMVRITPTAVGIEGSSIYLYDGEMLSMEHLLYALLLESANDAAVAIAVAVAGTVDAFVDMMNQKAASLHLSNTHFSNPHGLDHENHYTTAADLAHLAAYCLQNDLFRAIVSTQRMTIPLHDREGARLLLNHNRLLRSYQGAIGMKTGFTKRSGRCLVSAAERDGITMIAVTLNAPDDWDDHRSMLDYGFSQFTSLLLQGAHTYIRDIPLIGGQYSHIEITNRNDVYVILPQTHGDIHISCQAPRWLWMSEDITKGKVIGHLVWECDGQIIATEPLVANTSVSYPTTPDTWWTRLRSMFTGS